MGLIYIFHQISEQQNKDLRSKRFIVNSQDFKNSSIPCFPDIPKQI